MSGGYFNYTQDKIQQIIDDLEEYLDGRALDNDEVKEILQNPYSGLDPDIKKYIEENHHTLPNEYGFSQDTLSHMGMGVTVLKMALIYANSIDRLLSGDHSEDSFVRQLKSEIEKLKTDI